MSNCPVLSCPTQLQVFFGVWDHFLFAVSHTLDHLCPWSLRSDHCYAFAPASGHRNPSVWSLWKREEEESLFSPPYPKKVVSLCLTRERRVKGCVYGLPYRCLVSVLSHSGFSHTMLPHYLFQIIIGMPFYAYLAFNLSRCFHHHYFGVPVWLLTPMKAPAVMFYHLSFKLNSDCRS